MRLAILAVVLVTVSAAAGCEAGNDAEVGVDAPACRHLEDAVRANVETWTVIECRNEFVDGCWTCEIDTPFPDRPTVTWTVPGECEALAVCAEKTHH